MDALEALTAEHRLIEQVCDALEAFAAEVRSRSGDERAELERFVSFLREFADGTHHAKEEDVLFATLIEAGFPPHGGPVAVMLAEHREGRGYIATIASLAAQPRPWSDGDRVRLSEAAGAYVELLREHIGKEDGILYPIADQRLPAELRARVDCECERLDEGRARRGEQQRLLALGRDLIARYAPAMEEPA